MLHRSDRVDLDWWPFLTYAFTTESPMPVKSSAFVSGQPSISGRLEYAGGG